MLQEVLRAVALLEHRLVEPSRRLGPWTMQLTLLVVETLVNFTLLKLAICLNDILLFSVFAGCI